MGGTAALAAAVALSKATVAAMVVAVAAAMGTVGGCSCFDGEAGGGDGALCVSLCCKLG